MALTTRLNIKQSQSLVMTPQLLQSIKLLQYNQVELADYVETQLEQNPFLERSDENANENPDMSDASNPQTQDQLTGHEALTGSSDDISQSLDVDNESLFPEQTTASDSGSTVSSLSTGSSKLSQSGEELPGIEELGDVALTLSEHLQQQVGFFDLTTTQAQICHRLIDLIDPAGYLHIDLDELCEQLSAQNDDVQQALAALQNMEPSGIGARSLRECLALQLKDQNRLDPWAEAVLDNLDLVARQDIAKLRKVTKISETDIIEIISEIKALDPKPGLKFEHNVMETAFPDVRVKRGVDGLWKVELLTESLPKVLVNEEYYAFISKSSCKSDDKTFLNEKLQDANWLIRCLDQRARTILKVASEIVRQQDMFLTTGIAFLKPLNLATIASETELHESTVSRVTSNKYIETPRGVFEMRYFFSSAVSSADGADQISSESVKHQIKTLIDQENPAKILSDDTLVDLLDKKGICVARRTVAKYREALGIPSSVQRRRQKKQLLVG